MGCSSQFPRPCLRKASAEPQVAHVSHLLLLPSVGARLVCEHPTLRSVDTRSEAGAKTCGKRCRPLDEGRDRAIESLGIPVDLESSRVAQFVDELGA